VNPPSRPAVRLRFRLARVLYRLAAVLAGSALLGCALLKDDPGPGAPDWSFADQAGNRTDNQSGMFDGKHVRNAGVRDAGEGG
jgi:hypothetical protein